jgi:hypothetical protein
MKLLYKYTIIILLLSTTSCTSTFQVFDVSSNDCQTVNNQIIFENNDIKVSYNFWKDGGKVFFTFTNKTDAEIYIDWGKSHLIYNGISYEYWNDIEETTSFYSSVSLGSSNSFSNAAVNIYGNSAYGVSNSSSSAIANKLSASSTTKIKAKRIIFLPSNSSVNISKFTITNSAYYDCDFNLKSKNQSISFSKINSPLVFRNQIVYSKNEDFSKKISVDNSFYISSISFVKQKKFEGKTVSNTECSINGGKSTKVQFEYPYQKPNSFYQKIVTNN